MQQFSDKFSSDPFAGDMEGVTVEITGIGVVPQELTFSLVNDSAVLGGAVLALCVEVDGHIHVCGTAVMVAPGVAITASHSVDEVKAASTKRCFTYLAGTERLGLGLWRILQAYQPHNLDIAILTLARASSFKSKPQIAVAQPSALIPDAGESVTMLGYRATELDGTPIGKPLNIVPIQSTGLVLEEFPQGLGPWRPFPILNVDAKSIGGMSGGPVFDVQGHLIGVVSSSPSGECRPTFVALIWPLLLEPFNAVWPPGFHKPNSTLLSMSQSAGGLGTFVHNGHVVQRGIHPDTGELGIYLIR